MLQTEKHLRGYSKLNGEINNRFQGSELKKIPSHLLVTTKEIKVAKCKNLVAR